MPFLTVVIYYLLLQRLFNVSYIINRLQYHIVVQSVQMDKCVSVYMDWSERLAMKFDCSFFQLVTYHHSN